MPAPSGTRTIYARGLAAAREQLGAERFTRAWADGMALSLEQALSEADQAAWPRHDDDRADVEAVAALDHVMNATRLTTRLTERQAEVLRLVAEGKTNRQIAAELTLSDKTVGRHLENIFAKLAVSSRAAATRIAVREALISEGRTEWGKRPTHEAAGPLRDGVFDRS